MQKLDAAESVRAAETAEIARISVSLRFPKLPRMRKAFII